MAIDGGLVGPFTGVTVQLVINPTILTMMNRRRVDIVTMRVRVTANVNRPSILLSLSRIC